MDWMTKIEIARLRRIKHPRHQQNRRTKTELAPVASEVQKQVITEPEVESTGMSKKHRHNIRQQSCPK